jgi:hypothetical protein
MPQQWGDLEADDDDKFILKCDNIPSRTNWLLHKIFIVFTSSYNNEG